MGGGRRGAGGGGAGGGLLETYLAHAGQAYVLRCGETATNRPPGGPSFFLSLTTLGVNFPNLWGRPRTRRSYVCDPPSELLARREAVAASLGKGEGRSVLATACRPSRA